VIGNVSKYQKRYFLFVYIGKSTTSLNSHIVFGNVSLSCKLSWYIKTERNNSYISLVRLHNRPKKGTWLLKSSCYLSSSWHEGSNTIFEASILQYVSTTL